MRNISFVVFAASIILAASCNDEEVATLEPSPAQITTRNSFLPSYSPGLDLRLSTVYINGIGRVNLPWAHGANTQVPTDILKDHAEDKGWVTLYNLCSISETTKFGNSSPYLIFYNIFTGQLRGYAYVNNDVTGGNSTLWQLSFNQNTTLTNDFDSVLIAHDAGYNGNNSQIITNLTRTPAKSLSRGWNCFEFDLAIYDPDISNKAATMNIDLFDVTNLSLKMNGNGYSTTEGTIVAVNHNKSVGLNLDKIVANGAKVGASALADMCGLGNFSGGISDLVSNGVNYLFTKFFGRKTTSTDTSYVKLTTHEQLTMSGTISGNSQANFPSLSQLIVPGSLYYKTPYDVIPYYDEPLGVFYIAKTPTVKVVSKNVSFVKTNDNTPPVHGEGGSKYSRMKVYFTYGIGNEEPLEIVLNPVLESKIDYYEVSTAIVGDISGFERHTNSDGRNLGISSNAKIYGEKFISEQQGTSATMSYTQEYASTVSIPNNYTDAQEYYSRYQNLVRPTMPSNVELKVSVTLYPKASQYNPAPIVLTRTIKCNIERP